MFYYSADDCAGAAFADSFEAAERRETGTDRFDGLVPKNHPCHNPCSPHDEGLSGFVAKARHLGLTCEDTLERYLVATRSMDNDW